MSLDKLNYINVGKDGTFAPSGNANFDTTAADIDKMFAFLKEKKQRRLFLYFHGGLVNANSGMQAAERIVSHANLDTTACPYPVCFVWETGLVETLMQNFDTIKKSGFFKKLLVKIIKVAGKKLGVDIDDNLIGSKGIESMSEAEIKTELEKEAPFEKTFENPGKRSFSLKNVTPVNIEQDLFYENVIMPEVQASMMEEFSADFDLTELAKELSPDEIKLMNPDITDTAGEGEKGFLGLGKLVAVAVKVVIAVIKRHMKKRDHGFYPTIIEELFREVYIADVGAWFWSGMKDKAARMWKEDAFSGDPKTWHAGSYLLKKLKEYKDEVGSLTIDLIGHSAGSIVICELLNVVNQRSPGLTFRNIIFMAPACTCDLFDKTVLKFQSLYNRLRIYTMLDLYEQKDRLVPALYTRSLLYFISGVLETESDTCILGLQRHIIGNKPYDQEEILNNISKYLALEDRIVYAVTKADAVEGLRSGSQRHGDFDNAGEITLDSIFYLLKQ